MIDTSIQRVEINQVIENQLPEFVQAESPLFVDFMKQYYISQEYQGGSINIAENLEAKEFINEINLQSDLFAPNET